MIKNWILATRPKTLPAALVPVWVGSAPVILGDKHSFSWLIFASTLLGCLCIQIATNLFNDAIDSDKGADTEDRLGPVRLTASGLLSRKAVMTAALIVCGLGAIFAIPLVIAHGWVPIAIGVVSLLLAYVYTGGPFPLAYRGLGELFVIIFFGFVAVFGTYYMQTGEWFDKATISIGKLEWGPAGWLVALQVGLYSTVLIAINNLRDIDEDRRSNKRTMAVQLGKQVARWGIGLYCFLPIFGWFLYGHFDYMTLWPIVFSFLLASFITFHVFTKEPSPFYNKLLAVAALQLIHFALWFTIWLWQ